MENGFKIIDSDMHIIEPPEMWEKYIDGAFKDRAPKIVGSYPVGTYGRGWPGSVVPELGLRCYVYLPVRRASTACRTVTHAAVVGTTSSKCPASGRMSSCTTSYWLASATYCCT